MPKNVIEEVLLNLDQQNRRKKGLSIKDYNALQHSKGQIRTPFSNTGLTKCTGNTFKKFKSGDIVLSDQRDQALNF